VATRYGAGELYGFDFSALTAGRIRELASTSHREMPCPFKPAHKGKPVRRCNKKGGVCSLRLFAQDIGKPTELRGDPIVTCPNRFLEANTVVNWVGKTLLGTPNPKVLTELPFLMGDIQEEQEEAEADPVGKIDMVLVNAEGESLRWCALEMQAVYFSGKSMENDFKVMREWPGPGVPFPSAQRRPDFRSSGPKRLMPQLQVKVPTISRWGKKMAVVIDKAFWNSLSQMRETRDLSNAEIAWFVVTFERMDGRFVMRPDAVHYTTLGNAVEGLTGGTPMSLERFESELRERLQLL
jgi:hypothetical protein